MWKNMEEWTIYSFTVQVFKQTFANKCGQMWKTYPSEEAFLIL